MTSSLFLLESLGGALIPGEDSVALCPTYSSSHCGEMLPQTAKPILIDKTAIQVDTVRKCSVLLIVSFMNIFKTCSEVNWAIYL